MNLYTNNNAPIGNRLVSAILRYDLVPVPVSLEAVIYADDELIPKLTIGKRLRLENGITLSIVASRQEINPVIKDGKLISSVFVIAVFAPTAPLLDNTKRATALTGTSIGQIYKALGATAVFGSDIGVKDFVCLAGQLPTQSIALALQKEAGVVRYKDGKLHAVSLDNLFKQPPHTLTDTAVQWLANTQNTAQTPNYYSVDKDGYEVLGQSKGGQVGYLPNCDERQLNNLKKVLVCRGVMSRAMLDIPAGDVVAVGGKSYVVLTHAIRVDTASVGGVPAMLSKLWIADLG